MSHSSQSTDPRDSPPARWYARRANQTIGPLPTSEVIDLIQLGTLAGYDLLRLDGDDDWRKVSEIRKLLIPPEAADGEHDPVQLYALEAGPAAISPIIECDVEPTATEPASEEPLLEPEPDDDGHSAAHAAAELLSHMQADMLQATPGHSPKRRSIRIRQSYSVALIDGTAAVLTWIIVQTGRGLKLRSVQAALAVMLIAGAIWGIVLPRWPLDSRRVLDRFAGLSDRIEAQRNGEASPEEWQQLEQEVTATVGDSLNRLQHEAGSQRPDLQELLAAAELLPAAVREGQSGDDDRRLAASKLAIHLENAERHIERQAEISTRRTRRGTSFFTGDAMFWSIVVVDVLLGVGGLIWGVRTVIRRRRSRAAPTAA